MRNKLVLKIVMTALLTAIIFVQEEALSFIPNVQLTVLLLVLYGAYCGPKWGTAIVILHVLLDNLYVGSLTPYVMLPMFIGWEAILLASYFVRKKNVYIKATVAGLGALLYCWIFVFSSVLFYKVDMVAYIIADIPFEIILVVCSVITVLWLFNPLYKALKRKDVYELDKEKEDNDIEMKEVEETS